MIRNYLEELERKTLAEYAAFSDEATRDFAENECDMRTAFQRDRDRILHSKSFRRLKHKTQVYIAPIGDHFRTRLTHTLEVAQIARTIAKALRLNEDLTEAIALGHDLGHTPFGHSGERVLDKISPHGFRHNLNSLRVVEFLEQHKDMRGLNLTKEVRDGIKNHSGENVASTLEGKIIKFADRIAYINHDIDDSIRAGFLSADDIPKEIIKLLGNTPSDRIDSMVRDIITHSVDTPDVLMSDETYEAMMELRKFMFENIYNDKRSEIQGEKIEKLIAILYEHYRENPEDMGDHLKIYTDEDIDRIVTDYISGMTDQFAIEKFKELFLPTRFRRV